MNPQARFDVLKRLHTEVLASVEGVDDETLNRAPDGGGWSAAQVISHIIYAESGILRMIQKRMAEPECLRDASFKTALNCTALGMAMWSPIKIATPDGVKEDVEGGTQAELRARWDAVRADWGAFIDDFPAELHNKTVARHPVAGAMTLDQVLRFLKQHLRRHGKQIDRTLRAVQE